MSMRVLLFIVVSTTLFDLGAQDMHFSQATNFPLLLNPAYSGLYNAKSRAVVSMRNQNIAIPNTAFTGVYNTLGASFETKICEELTNQNTWSVGVMALSDYAGSGTLATNQIMVTTGYNVSMDRYGKFLPMTCFSNPRSKNMPSTLAYPTWNLFWMAEPKLYLHSTSG
jgi:hypothetical protein